MSASTAEIRAKQRSYIKCTNIIARLNIGRVLQGAYISMIGLGAGWNCLLKRSSNIEGFISGITEACKHFIVEF